MERRLFKEDLEIPFMNYYMGKKTKEKTYLGYPSYSSELTKNFKFYDTLIFQHFSKGRSSVKAHFISKSTGNRYEMFLKDLEHLLEEGYNVNDLEGEFCFRKAGSNYGLVLLEDAKE